MKKLNHKKQKGLSMIELGLVFTVIAVAIAGTLYAYSSVKNAYNIQQTNTEMQLIATAEEAYMYDSQAQGPQTDLNKLHTMGYIDQDFSKTNSPFGGTYSVASVSDTDNERQFTIALNVHDTGICQRMENEWSHASAMTKANCSDKTITITYNPKS
ncbi:type II secretion system protein [Fangia hongkongensis]|uniref:type II secretion system protein n=1 Tax=Fangia hongkongensis TaxID=270495 RepID=UPI0003639AF5|nr:type II secretion system protein [Fangia hongkongensis]MBK2124005.1 type II secretion system protein [Fangia hongkongensis]